MTDDVTASGPAGVDADAKAKADAAGAVGQKRRSDGSPGLSPGQLALRDAAIIAAVHAGREVREIAKERGITPRSVQRVMARFNTQPTGMDSRAMEILEGLLREYREQIRTFTALAEDTVERAPAVAVAALRSAADATERRLALLNATGKLPANLTLFKTQRELKMIVARLRAMLEQAARDGRSVADVLEELRELQARELGEPIDGVAIEQPALERGSG